MLIGPKPVDRAAAVRRAGWTWMASLLVHGVVIGVVTVVAVVNLRHQREEEARLRAQQPRDPIPIELPSVAEGTLRSEADEERVGAQPVVTGGATAQRLDTGRDGRGGDPASAVQATHLSDRDEALHLSPDPVSHLDRDQMHRIRSNARRASWEDRRMTTHPMELTFIATGRGDVQQRRPISRDDPSRGAMRSQDAARAGGKVGPAFEDDGDERAAKRDFGADRDGRPYSAPGTGQHDARPGEDHHLAADVTRARPDVTEGPVAVAATERDRPRDNVDSEQDVAKALRSIVHGSYAGGPEGAGRGGSGGGGAPGAGGVAEEGSHPPPLGLNDGDIYDLETSDPRLLPYFRKLHAKIEPFWQNAFPRSAILDLKQGTVILEFIVFEDGSAKVTWPPVRPSGIDEFDRNCADAIRRAAPFEPIPRVLGVSRLHIRAPFVARNPIVK